MGEPYPDFGYRFTDDSGAAADPATGGELWLRVPLEIRVTDYPSGRSLTDAEGWVATGDICRRLGDGALQFLGRRAEFLNIEGNKRAPQWFEAALHGRPGVADVAAFRLLAVEAIPVTAAGKTDRARLSQAFHPRDPSDPRPEPAIHKEP